MICAKIEIPEASDEGPAAPASRQAARGLAPVREPEIEIDLERVVWDPEYRDEVRALLRPGG